MAINDILVRDLSLPSKTSDFRVTAANPLLNQTGILSSRNIMVSTWCYKYRRVFNSRR
jgi:hypothetical protein